MASYKREETLAEARFKQRPKPTGAVAASKRFARRSKMSDTDVFKYATSQAQKYGGTVRAGKATGHPLRRKELLSSYSRRTTESSRRRALQKILGGYGQKLRP